MIRRYIIEADDSLKGFDEAIEKLEREWGAEEVESSEDCVSRSDLLKHQKTIFADDKLRYKVVFPETIETAPSVQPQPKRGKWIVIRKEYEFMGGIVNEPQGCKCSNCGGIVKFKSGFCPSCGSYNGGEKDGNE